MLILYFNKRSGGKEDVEYHGVHGYGSQKGNIRAFGRIINFVCRFLGNAGGAGVKFMKCIVAENWKFGSYTQRYLNLHMNTIAMYRAWYWLYKCGWGWPLCISYWNHIIGGVITISVPLHVMGSCDMRKFRVKWKNEILDQTSGTADFGGLFWEYANNHHHQNERAFADQFVQWGMQDY